jgi:biopolymer transport protein ExbB/TolQ
MSWSLKSIIVIIIIIIIVIIIIIIVIIIIIIIVINTTRRLTMAWANLGSHPQALKAIQRLQESFARSLGQQDSRPAAPRCCSVNASLYAQ